VRRVLTQAVGKQKADMLLDRVSTGQTGQGIEALKWMEAKSVAQIISAEHPQIGAIVLSHLDADQAASIMPLLTEDMRTEILMRIASLNEVPQSALSELDQLVEKQAQAPPPPPLRRIGGARTVANILNAMEKEKSGEEMGKIEKADGRCTSRSRICCSFSTIFWTSTIAASKRFCAKWAPIPWRWHCAAPSRRCRTRFCATCRSARQKFSRTIWRRVAR
jgi:flagellar motor switch protein FliG